MRRVLSGAPMAVLVLIVAACSKPEIDPLKLDRNQVTIDNRTDHDWTDVEIWINRQYRAKAPKIVKGQRLHAPLNLFVTGYGQRFNFSRQQITDVFLDWQRRTSDCLKLAQQQGEIASDHDLDEISSFFWIGWEGAVLRAKLERSAQPLKTFAQQFVRSLAP